MSLIRLNTTPSPRDLQLFGGLWLFFFGVFGALAWQKGAHPTAWVAWSIGGAVSGPGLIFPRWLRLCYLAAIYATYPLGIVSSCLVLGIFYYIILTPIGLVLRLAGRDPLTRGRDPGLKTYWRFRDSSKSVRSYFRQY